MPNIAIVKKDFMDTVVDFFNKEQREIFKTFNSIFVGNKHLTGIDTASTKAGLDIFPKMFDAFNVLDFMANMKNVKNHLNGKVVSQDVASLTSDTVNSAAETTAWCSSVGLLSLKAYTMSWVTSISGATLMFSFAKRIRDNISDLRKPENKDPIKAKSERKNTLWNLAKNIAIFAIGAILFTCGWFGFAMFTNLITIASSVTVIAAFKLYQLQLQQKEEVAPSLFQKVKNKFIAAPVSA
ncbi:MAG: hypothetical protein K940chlam1_00263 [Candidatus Anoxychlamydiales bacterium]|nr:hypothetical protein [Candidatus Anoxychlamydiales bacterium]NGX35585.1 hypothetical protein [Candidatus Anoxychlamydiales bacterium]